ncbi:MAG: hypothetical protein LBK27_04060 [Treponema sp.]|jgi:hypothetical protein|nr:hypothetical protein [Treponema sp.]
MKRLYNHLPPLLLWAPDGAGGGGVPPGEIPLDEWITRLNEAERKDQAAIVAELAGKLGIKTGAAYKKLKEAGWNPQKNDTPPKNTPATQEIFPVTLRHKSPYPLYRRAGLLLTKQWKPYGVTAEQRAALQADTWVEFQSVSGPGTP